MDAAESVSAVSLRRTALLYMTFVLAVIGAATIPIAYLYAHDAATEFLDGQLRQIALNAGPGIAVSDAPAGADQDPEDQYAIAIWDAQRRLVHASLPFVHIARQNRPGFANVEAAGEQWRVYTASDLTQTVQVAQRERVRDEIERSAALGAAAPVLIAIPLSWLVIGGAMNRVFKRLNALADGLAKRGARTTEPIALAGVPTEVAPLVAGMNSLIARLHAAPEAQKQFLSDAAHELRTPLAAMQIQVDNLSRRTRRAPGEPATALAGGVRRAASLVNQLLHLARLDEPEAAREENVDVSALLLDCVADHAAAADRKRVHIEANIGCSAECRGAPEEVRVLLSNLMDNAVKYTPPGGMIGVSVERRESAFVVEISNTGSGLPEGAESKIFDRFFRAAPQGVEGTGLGLAIVRRVADRHGFDLAVENRVDGVTGVVARMSIPPNDSRDGQG
jgi:two-component system OmpR family sensor kinase